jgi:predicted AlkP superfamily phosphohydrolase/phosphomutase
VPRGRTIVIALDAMDAGLVAEFVAAGELPAIGSLLGTSARVRLEAPMGVFVSANWPTLYTATGPDRHGYLCWNEYVGGSYERRETDPTWVRGTPFWETLAGAGRRVAVFDVPHSISRDFGGTIVTEWGCHDRHFGTASWPPGLAAALSAAHGRHPVGEAAKPAPERDQFAPCDYIHRAGPIRTTDETIALFEAIVDGARRKTAASLALLDAEEWDLFFTVYGESHCVGHQLWHLHDPEHPHHDRGLAERLGGDPVRAIYRELDRSVAAHIERATPEDNVVVLLAHGMAAHNDGTHLFDEILHRLDWSLDHPGEHRGLTRLAGAVTDPFPGAVTRPALRALAPLLRRRSVGQTDETIPSEAERRWFPALNNTVVGAVRLNLAGREPAGRIHPADQRAALAWLADRLRELVNVDTGGPVVSSCTVTEDVYRRAPGDAFGDLYVEWEHSAPIERVWSPAIGTVHIPYEHWRQGDHVREGLMLVRGPGIEVGDAGRFAIVDVAPTIAALLGASLPDVDGRPIPGVAPGVTRSRGGRSHVRSPRSLPARLAPRAARRSSRRGRSVPDWAHRHDPDTDRLRAEVRQGHATAAARADATDARLAALTDRVDELTTALEAHDSALRQAARMHDIHTMKAWLSGTEFTSEALVSVVMPTHDRAGYLAGAIASVQAQTHQRWELLVVDDGSMDATPELLARIDDPRIRVFSIPHSGCAVARNVALDAAAGDLVAYLDDDNRYDADWLKAVALTFDERPLATVCFGARVIDDLGRAHGGAGTGVPAVHFLPWDRAALRQHNRADMNVIAHRRSAVRLDPELKMLADWDLLLALTAEQDPVEIPAIAAYYTTSAPTRISTTIASAELQAEYARVRGKLATGGLRE